MHKEISWNGRVGGVWPPYKYLFAPALFAAVDGMVLCRLHICTAESSGAAGSLARRNLNQSEDQHKQMLRLEHLTRGKTSSTRMLQALICPLRIM